MSSPLTDFLQSLVLEVVGILITIFGIERLIRRREERRMNSLKTILLKKIHWRCLLLRTWIALIPHYEVGKIPESDLGAMDQIADDMVEALIVGGDYIPSKIKETVLQLNETIQKLIVSAQLKESVFDALKTHTENAENQTVSILELLKKEGVNGSILPPSIHWEH
jgi:hypothetical protein